MSQRKAVVVVVGLALVLSLGVGAIVGYVAGGSSFGGHEPSRPTPVAPATPPATPIVAP